MIHNFLLAQLVGAFGIGCYVWSYQIKKNRKLYIVQAIGCSMFCIQFFMLNAVTGCISLIILITRNLLLTRYHEWKWVQWRGWIVVFSIFAILNTWLTWEGFISLLPCFGLIAGNYGMWSNNARTIRIANAFIVSPLYIVYDIAVGSIAGVLNELFTISSVLVSIKRFGWKNLGNPDSDFQK